MIIVNFKNYKTGEEVLKLAKKIQKYNKKIIVAVPAINIKEVSEKTNLQTFAQHINSKSGEKTTGFITAKSIRNAGASGTLLNHSEHPIYFDILKKTVEECKRYNLKTLICSNSLYEVKRMLKLKPNYIAFEDPKLIATEKSITKYNPKSIRKFVKILKGERIMPICGAGISTPEDYEEALKLGCRGVLISSAIAGSKSPDKILKKLRY